MARPTSSRIRPGVDLHRIVIDLDRHKPPSLEMVGNLSTGNRQVDQASSVTIRTMLVDRKTADFIEHVKSLFATPTA